MAPLLTEFDDTFSAYHKSALEEGKEQKKSVDHETRQL
jgi:hypothetical protein